MKLLAVATAVVLNGIIGTQCTGSGTSSVLPKHWYASLNVSPLLGYECPGSLKKGYFGGSKHDSGRSVMVELRILSETEAAVTAFFRNATDMVFIEIPNVTYTLFPQTLDQKTVCAMQLDMDQNYGTRVKLFPRPVTSIETTDIHKLIPEMSSWAGNPRLGGVVASPNLIYGVVPMQRITKTVDWKSFLEKEMKPFGGRFLTTSLIDLLRRRATPKSAGFIYGISSTLLAAVMLFAFMSV